MRCLARMFLGGLTLAALALPAAAQDAAETAPAPRPDEAAAPDAERDAAAPPVWTPPAEPDVSAIYDEVRTDLRAGRHALAADKARWYWEHAEAHLPAHSGVRVSFFLGTWFELAEAHPPAREHIRAARSQALKRAVSEHDADALSDVVHLNARLGESEATVELVRTLLDVAPHFTRGSLRWFEDELLEQRAYELWIDCARPEQLLAEDGVTHRTLRCVGGEHGKGRRCTCEFLAKQLLKKTLGRVAALASLGRHDEARAYADAARELDPELDFGPALERALRGEAPPPDDYPRLEPWVRKPWDLAPLDKGWQRGR